MAGDVISVIVGLAIIYFGVAFVWGILRAIFGAVFGGGNRFDVRTVDTRLGDRQEGPAAKVLEVRGALPVTRPTRVGILVSIFDETRGEPVPVLSAIDQLREPGGIVFQLSTDIGLVNAGNGTRDWVQVGAIIPEALIPPFSGARRLVAFVRIVDLDNPPLVMHGFTPDNQGILWVQELRFTHTFSEKGYEEVEEQRDEANKLAVRMGVAIAMADGEFHEAEGQVLKGWIKQSIEPFSGVRQTALKDLLNGAFKDAYKEAAEGSLTLSSLTAKMNDIGDKRVKMEAITLCCKVMAADGVIAPEEIRQIRGLGSALAIDDELLNELIRGHSYQEAGAVGGATDEEILGIDPMWPPAKIRKRLRQEYRIWNSRTSVLNDEERSKAERMMDVIARLRIKYG